MYKVKIATGEFSTVLEFTSAGAINRGAFPAAALTSDGAGFLWGTTNNGGAGDFGTVFKVNTTAGSLSTVQEFTSNGASTKGAYPQGSLVGDGAGSFYGTTSSGGPLDLGTVFKVNIGTGALTTMAEFSGNGATNKGNTPQAGLFNNGAGLFWGVTSGGGATGDGTVFTLDATSGVLTTMIEFNGAGPIIEGEGPFGGLAPDGAGNLWGTTGTGGALNQGTVFKVNAATGVLTTVLDFTGDIAPARGSQPMAGLTSDGAGYFWGTTNSGGANGFGTVFKLNASTIALTTLVEFTGSGGTHRGAGPFSELVSDGLGYFWGTTYSGGIGYGTVFKINASTGAFTTVFEFDFTTGSAPKSGLVRDDAGDLWGTTSGGGNSGDGTIYTINPTTGATSTFMHFSGIGYQRSSGGNPGFATLYRRSDGGLYGSTERGGPGAGGTVFRLRFALSPIEQWKLAQLGDALSPDSEDPDGDGTSTLAEYALLKLPGIPDGASLIASRANYAEGERLRVFVPRDPARHDVAVVVEGAGSPAGPWSPLATSTLGAPFTGPGYFGGDSATSGLKTVEVRDTVNITAAPRRFIRMRVLH